MRSMHFRVQTAENGTVVTLLDKQDDEYDNDGAVYYVVVVVLIYGLSIVMMIASHIRRNNQDGQLRSYLKEMASLRKKNRREKLIEKMTRLTNKPSPRQNYRKIEATIPEIKRDKEGLYCHLPTDADDDPRDTSLRTSVSDLEDSVFSTDTPKIESPATPKLSPSNYFTPKFSRTDKSFFQIHVINENTIL